MSPRFESEVATEKLNGQIRRSIQYLRRILDAGERGYAVAAAYVNNRALKMLFKTYAQQQATFKSELSKEMKPAFGGRHSVTDILAILHRGRINIFAAMTIGGLDRERVVLKENLIGERAALQAYNRARQSGLPGQLDALVRQQREAVQMAAQQVALMLGKDGKNWCAPG